MDRELRDWNEEAKHMTLAEDMAAVGEHAEEIIADALDEMYSNLETLMRDLRKRRENEWRDHDTWAQFEKIKQQARERLNSDSMPIDIAIRSAALSAHHEYLKANDPAEWQRVQDWQKQRDREESEQLQLDSFQRYLTEEHPDECERWHALPRAWQLEESTRRKAETSAWIERRWRRQLAEYEQEREEERASLANEA